MGWKWNESWIQKLPKEAERAGVRTVRGAVYAEVTSTPVQNPRWVVQNEALLQLMGVYGDEQLLSELSGNLRPRGVATTYAHTYAGHQFGNFAGQLGDGAAISLGAAECADGTVREVQLKGAGLTPYSRTADGRKVLRSSIREFLASEAMAGLGIPTTRAAALVDSDDTVLRDKYYDGRPLPERCAVVTRVAESFLRFGSFEVCLPRDPRTGMAGPSDGLAPSLLASLLDYTVERHFPEFWSAEHSSTMAARFFEAVVASTARLVAAWQAVGFCHGVLNTDNLSIHGVTLDYGPFGFLDHYDPDHVCNGSDSAGRYAFRAQPAICRWNCERLATALEPLLPRAVSEEVLSRVYQAQFDQAYDGAMARKLGLQSTAEARRLGHDFLELLEHTGVDYTRAFRALSQWGPSADEAEDPNKKLPMAAAAFFARHVAPHRYSWAEQRVRGKPRLSEEALAELKALRDESPLQLPLYGLSAEFVDAEERRHRRLADLHEMGDEASALRLAESKWSRWLVDYTAALRAENWPSDARVRAMNAANPLYILRNHLAQHAVALAEKGDYSEVQKLHKLLQNPFSESPLFDEGADSIYASRAPSESCALKVNCSS